MQIKEMLTKAQALELFEREAALFGKGFYTGSDPEGVPLYRIGDLFGPWALDLFEKDRSENTVFQRGRDCGLVGGAAYEGFCFEVLHRQGFMQMVAYHNRRIAYENRLASEGGRYLEALDKARKAKCEAEQAEERRKLEERAAKRKAARKAKQEAAEQAVNA